MGCAKGICKSSDHPLRGLSHGSWGCRHAARMGALPFLGTPRPPPHAGAPIQRLFFAAPLSLTRAWCAVQGGITHVEYAKLVRQREQPAAGEVTGPRHFSRCVCPIEVAVALMGPLLLGAGSNCSADFWARREEESGAARCATHGAAASSAGRLEEPQGDAAVAGVLAYLAGGCVSDACPRQEALGCKYTAAQRTKYLSRPVAAPARTVALLSSLATPLLLCFSRRWGARLGQDLYGAGEGLVAELRERERDDDRRACDLCACGCV